MIEYSQRFTARLLCAVLLVSNAGCYVPSGGERNEPAPAHRDAISIFSFDKQLDYSEDRLLQEIEKRTSTQIEIISTPWDDMQLDIMVASGDYPDIITIVDSDRRGRFQKWVNDGILIPFDDELLEDLPYLSEAVRKPKYDDLRINGIHYGLPLKDEYPEGSAGHYVWHIREDWLSNLGLPIPSTLDEFQQTLKAFKYGDPTGTGQETDGVLINGIYSMVKYIMGAWGIPVDVQSTGFLQVGDQYEYWVIQPEVKEALLFTRQLYEEGLIHPASISMESITQTRPLFMEGKIGVMLDSMNFEKLLKKQTRIQEQQENAKLITMPAMAGPQGLRGYSRGSDFWGYTVITNKAENPKAAARLLDFLLSPEGRELTLFGVEGIHYTVEGPRRVLNMEERIKDPGFHTDVYGGLHELNWGLVKWSEMTSASYLELRESIDPGFTAMVEQNLQRVNRYLVEPAAYHVMTPQWISFKITSDELVKDYFNRMIMGELPVEEGFEQFVDKWLATGGREAMQEMSDAIAQWKAEKGE
ncbi:extracellular solute-binding protein [Paenibacillus senegalensis]|uniref:extracellular solute-binding protein n=1 Tax=Paenibacillus senegalensis TaxID=1465766 RepID=UPI00028961D6|nr:extracellular solute-binding protein [Paenibacillus senegalensis]